MLEQDGLRKDAKAKIKHKHIRMCPSADIQHASVQGRQNRNQQKHCSTSGSHVIPQRSTGEAQPNLTSVIGREPVCCGWYDRSMPTSNY